MVELHIPEALLARLDVDPVAAGVWVGVVGDVAGQHACRERRLRDLDGHPGDRVPRAALRRHTQIRDRACVHKGCRAPARGCDQDHTIDHAFGGPTIADDLAPTCRHDHRLKSEGGWRLVQPDPGRFVWTSPLGCTYVVGRAPIVAPLVPVVARAGEVWFDEPAEDREYALGLESRGGRGLPRYDPHAYYDQPAPAPMPQPVDLDDQPPF